MRPERWRLAKEIADEALDLESPDRTAFLERACDGDAELRVEIASLIASCEASDGVADWLEAPAIHALLGVEGDAEPQSLVGARAGGYRLTGVLASGGMGTVYGARRDDGEFERDVAVKVLKRGLDTDELLARFANERRALARLRHPNVVELLDAGSVPDGRPYFVMELVDGVPIDRFAAERGLSVEARVRLFLAACGGVEHAHRHLVVHRDLKPGHVLVTPDGHPKLLDFGVAKLLAGDESAATRADSRAPMTLRYASPEQIRGETATTASDVYALGVVLYELLAGTSPYTETVDAAALRRAVLEEAPPPPSARAPRDVARRLRGDLDAVVLKALCKEPERRYASAAELGDDLRRHLEASPVSAKRDTLRASLARLVKRHRAGVAAAAAVVAALLVAVVATSASLVRARAAETVAWRAHAQALAVASFLESALATGDLEAAALRIDVDFADMPEARGRAHAAVAHHFLRLGRAADAAPHARAALELAQTTRGFGSSDVARYEALVRACGL